MRSLLIVLTAVAFAPSAAAQTVPPPMINYQGVLLDNVTGAPLTGSYDMIFGFHKGPGDDGAFGPETEIMRDVRLVAATTGPVVVTQGLFEVLLGTGQIEDGDGIFPNEPYTSLDQVFRDFVEVYLVVQIGTGIPGSFETLFPPTCVASAPYAFNAAMLNGSDGSSFLDMSATPQTKQGNLTVSDLTVDGNDLRFGTLGSRISTVATNLTVVSGDQDSDSLVLSAGNSIDDGGILINGDASFAMASGNGTFSFVNGGTSVTTGTLDATGNFQIADDLTVSGGDTRFGAPGAGLLATPLVMVVRAGDADTDDLHLVAGNSFDDGSLLLTGDGSIEMRSGNGLFSFLYGPGLTPIATLNFSGLSLYGDLTLGTDGITPSITAPVNCAGIATCIDFVGTLLFLGLGDGPDDHVQVRGDLGVAGTKNFVQNHPLRQDLSIYYTALEGDEAGTYTRGTARLSGGVARVSLGETFSWVTNPEIGLTAHVTPRGGWSDLYVEAVSTTELVVRSRDGGDVAFDYVVNGLRIGYEDFRVVQPRRMEGALPPAGLHDAWGGAAEGAAPSALARFREMEMAAGREMEPERDEPETMTAGRLRRAIGEFEPPQTVVAASPSMARMATDGAADVSSDTVARPPVERAREPLPARPETPELAARVPVIGDVEAGDVLVADHRHPGFLRRAESEADPAVAGVVTAEPGAPSGDQEAGVLVAFAGIVPCRVDAGYGSILVGDLLTTSPMAGHAMRADDPRPGTIIGKALEPLESGTGTIRILVMLR